MNNVAQIALDLSTVQEQIQCACDASGRNRSDVSLVAVTKYASLESVRALHSLGVLEFGESRLQQLVERADELSPEIHWHFIGPLQRNKVRKTLLCASLIHSVDSVRLLATIDRVAEELAVQPSVLLEVNIAGEATKKGFTVDGLMADWDTVQRFQHVRLAGLMTMAPRGDIEQSANEQARFVFRTLRELRDELIACSVHSVSDSQPSLLLSELSMGMSSDFKIAIEEGATLIRIGRQLFHGVNGH